jgi:hypothetical protein
VENINSKKYLRVGKKLISTKKNVNKQWIQDKWNIPEISKRVSEETGVVA